MIERLKLVSILDGTARLEKKSLKKDHKFGITRSFYSCVTYILIITIKKSNLLLFPN